MNNIQREENSENSLEAICKAIELNPQDPALYHKKAEIYRDQQEYEQALEAIAKAIDLNPQNPDFYDSKAEIYLSKQDYDQALEAISKAIELEPSDPTRYAKKAEIYLGQNQEADAWEAICKAIELTTQDPQWYVKKRTHNELNKYTLAIKFDLRSENIIKEYAGTALKDLFLHIGRKSFKQYWVGLELKPKKYQYLFQIIKKSSVTLFLNILEKAFNLGSMKFYRKDYFDVAKYFDAGDFSDTVKLESHLESLKQRLLARYPHFVGSLQEVYERDVQENLFSLSIKLCMLSDIFDEYRRELERLDSANQTITKNVPDFLDFYQNLSEFQSYALRLKLEKEAEEKIKQKNRILQEFSHNIKNTFIKTTAALENLKVEYSKQQEPVPQEIETALQQIKKIQTIANAINFSFKGNIDDLCYDIQHPKDPKSIQEIILNALENSVENILNPSGVYSNFADNYFTLKVKKEVRASFYKADKHRHFESFKRFFEQYFAKLDVDFGNAEKCLIGNERHSFTKLSILIEELVFNAVKYVSLTPPESRFVSIALTQDSKWVCFKIKNAFNPSKSNIKTTGIGTEVVNNIATSLEMLYKRVNDAANVYHVEVQFKNFWRT